jgi:hypothetical protein
LSNSRKLFTAEFAALPTDLKALRNPPHYPLETSQKLADLRERTITKYAVRR